MIKYLFALGACLTSCMLPAQENSWQTKSGKYFNLYYTVTDDAFVDAITSDLEQGAKAVENYFSVPFRKKFDVYLLPNRQSLDSTWRKLWNEPDFNSQCWMVASGDVTGLHILSPRVWKNEACEHDPDNKQHVYKLLTHEVVHVYHSQFITKANMGELESIAWFVEGLATHVSGQLNIQRLEQVRQVILENKNPTVLEDFWSGKARYGQSGYLVEYIEKQKGRKFLFDLLTMADENSILKQLGTTERELIEACKKYVIGL